MDHDEEATVTGKRAGSGAVRPGGTGPGATRRLADAAVVTAPDGSTVRPLLATERGSMARFELEPGQTSLAVRHRTVEEIWVVLEGHGRMWRRSGDDASDVVLEPGVSLVIPVGASFQFRNDGSETLLVVAVTMPPWPGAGEAEIVDGAPGW